MGFERNAGTSGKGRYQGRFHYKADEGNRLWVHKQNRGIVFADSLFVPADGVLFDPATTANDLYSLIYSLTSRTSGGIVIIALDYDASNNTAPPDRVFTALTFPVSKVLAFQGPFIMTGADKLRGLTNMLAEDVWCHLRVTKVSDTLTT